MANTGSITEAAGETVRSVLRGDFNQKSSNGRNKGQSGGGEHGSHGGSQINVGSSERDISIAAGAAIGLLGLTRPLSIRGLLMLGVGGALVYRGVSGNCSLYSALGISTRDKDANEPSAKPSEYFSRAIHVEQSVTINKPASEIYSYWRNFENLPKIMKHLKEVHTIDDKKSRWVAKAPLGYSVEWEAEIINDEKDSVIAWRSIGDATVDNSGSVRFIKNSDGETQVRVTIDYIPPAGKLGAIAAKLFGENPDTQVSEDLRRLKQIMETGEIATNESPRGQN